MQGMFMREFRVLLIVITAAFIAMPGMAQGAGAEEATTKTAAPTVKAKEFNPKDIDKLKFFIESVTGMVIATNTSEEAYNNTRENTPTEKVWTDQKRFPHGTVRWWQDQSPYKNTKRPTMPFDNSGRAFGQDDHDRPGYIPDGCNGKPCARGGMADPNMKGKFGHHQKQACYFELQPEDRLIRKDRLQGPLSFFILVRPVQQKRDFVYFGTFHNSNLLHKSKDNSLVFKHMNIDKETGKNLSVNAKLTGPNAVAIDKWQLIEVHRDKDSKLQCVVNGQDLTVGEPSADGPFQFVFLMNNNKNVWGAADPFTGDLAAFVLYNKELTEAEKQNVRDYFNGIYGYMADAKAVAESGDKKPIAKTATTQPAAKETKVSPATEKK